MASKKQVEAKALKLGGKLEVDAYSATLISPVGKHLDGYHSQTDYFDDGKQVTWDNFWDALKNIEDCDCRTEGKNKSEPTAWEIKFRAYAVATLGEEAVKAAEEAEVSGIEQLVAKLKTTRAQKAKKGTN